MNTGYKNYDKYPCVKTGFFAKKGYEKLREEIKNTFDRIVIIDCYTGVDKDEIKDNIAHLFDLVIDSDECALSGDELTEKLSYDLTDDRVFGRMTTHVLSEYFVESKVRQAKAIIASQKGRVLVIGVGALLLCDSGTVIHASIARWETQLRFRKGLCNWNCDNSDEDCLTKFKRGYFCEWRLADKHKVANIDKIQYFLDTNEKGMPVLISKKDYFAAMAKTVCAPFRVVPYFDPGVWGGQWMKQVCGLDKSSKNYAWCFDCVPEENSMYYDFCGTRVQMPAIDLVLFMPKKLLGERVNARFGNEFPIRFDFLDTMQGGNLSLQVHPTTEYIQKTFNMHYTQDESYYILDCEEDGSVYLGLKNGADKNEFVSALTEAQQTGRMDVEKYVNKFPAKKHDHFLIPSGTVHCSGANSMVLEISSTPYIFTFKLWDWGRLGLDGKPRPINVGHGRHVIDESRDTDWVKKNLVNAVTQISETPHCREEKTGLHEIEFIETRRHWFDADVLHKANGSVCVLNLVEGSEAEVVSTDGSFEPFEVHYAETFIVPASVGDFIIRPTSRSQGEKLATVKAYVRS